MEEDTKPYITTSNKFKCPHCGKIVAVGKGVSLCQCRHQCCFQCLHAYIINTNTAVVTCPNKKCSAVIEDRELRNIGGPDFCARYDNLCSQLAANSINNKVFCKTIHCNGWAVYKRKNGFFTCQICFKSNCLKCEAIHENMLCEEYQEILLTRATSELCLDSNPFPKLLRKRKVTKKVPVADYGAAVTDDDRPYYTNYSEFDCPICFDNVAINEGVILRGCAHQVCFECCRNYIDNIGKAEVCCPHDDCDSLLEDREVRGIGSEQGFQRYVYASNKQAAASVKHSFHCKTPDCKGWAIYENLNAVFRCAYCNCENCLTCGAIHENQSCKNYQDNLRINEDNDAAIRASSKFLKNLEESGDAMQCPGCHILIEKIEGCDSVRCSNCKMEICWATRQPRWGPRGRGDISGGCRCGVNGKKCHPKCNFCH